MNIETALRIMGLEAGATEEQVELAKRRLLAAIHPDKHMGTERALFERLASDVIEAAGVLVANARKSRSAPHSGHDVASVLFDVRASESWNRANEAKGGALARFDHRYANDKILAVGVLGLDPHFEWHMTNGFTGHRDNKVGTALYVVAWNRTRRRVEGLDLEKGLLIDDYGNQYSCDGSFYWADAAGSFHRHSADVAPMAKLDGFLLYPPLRAGATYFTRWFLADSFTVEDKYISGEYDVHLPGEPQRAAALLAASPDADNLEEDFDQSDELNDADANDADDDDEEDDNDTEDDDMDDRWLYGEDATEPREHRYLANDICVNCGKSRGAIEAFGWPCDYA
jgi:hypothetical protein